MSFFFENLIKKPIINTRSFFLFFIETLLFSYVIWWFSMRMDLDLPSYVILLSFFTASYLGYALAFTELRFYIVLIIILILLFLIYFISQFLISFIDTITDTSLEFTFFYFQKYFYIITLFFTLGFIFNWFLYRWKSFFYIEVFLLISSMILIFKVHRNYRLSKLDLFDSFLTPYTSEIMLFFIFMFIFLVFIILFFFFEEDGSRYKLKSLSFLNRGYNSAKTLLGLVLLLLIIGVTLYRVVKKEEPKMMGGLQLKFEEKEFLTLYPKVNINEKERKLIVKMEVDQQNHLTGSLNSSNSHYIRWKILSGYHKKKNLFFYNPNAFEKNIPKDSEDHFFKRNTEKKVFRFKPSYNYSILSLSNLLTLQGLPFLQSMSAQIKKINFDNILNKKRKKIDQEYYILNFPKNANLALNFPTLIKPIKNKNSQLFSATYRVESQFFDGSAYDLALISNYSDSDPEFLAYYTKAPNDPRYKALARQITQGTSNPYEKAFLLVKYFKDNFDYSLNPGGENKKDRLSYFLFENKKGYCTYFAFSLTSLVRSIGIPSRVVVGLTTDPDNKVENYYILHASNMHAWVEVYFKGYGWIVFDPTPGLGQTRYNDQDFLKKIVGDLETETKDLLLTKKEPKTKDNADAKKDETDFNWTLLILILPVGLIGIFTGKEFYKLSCKQEKDPLRQVYRYNFFILSRLKDFYIKRNSLETRKHFAHRILEKENIDINRLTTLYLTAKYRHELPKNTLDELDKAYGEWETSIKQRYPFWKIFLSKLNFYFFLRK